MKHIIILMGILVCVSCTSSKTKDQPSKQKEEKKTTFIDSIELGPAKFKTGNSCTDKGKNKVKLNLLLPTKDYNRALDSILKKQTLKQVQEHMIPLEKDLASTIDSTHDISYYTKKWSRNFLKDACRTQKKIKMSMPWSLDMEMIAGWNKKGLLSVQFKTYNFTGGAHGHNSQDFFTIDLNNNEMLHLKDLIQDTSAFKKISTNLLRDTLKIDSAASLTDAGLMQEYLPMPLNWGLSSQGLVLHYNPYEIAPYAMGSFHLVVPFAQLEGILQEEIWGKIQSQKLT